MKVATIQKTEQETYFVASVLTDDDVELSGISGANISPRGVTLCCTPEQIKCFNYGVDKEQQTKYKSVLLTLVMHLASGEDIELETRADVHSICRRSQTVFEVNLIFKDMMQDGYRHIARYIVESEDHSA